jgi:hypothetical protein
MRSFPVLLLAGVLAGCGGKPAPANPIEVVATSYDPIAMMQTPLVDGAPLDLVRPPQGGFVVFVGAIARNLGDTTVALHGALRDPSGVTIAEDSRTVSMQPSAEDPTALVPDLRSFTNVANVAVCPSSTTSDRFDMPFQIAVDVTEVSTRRTGSAVVNVVPSCRQADPMQLTLCKCECAANYSLGKCSM